MWEAVPHTALPRVWASQYPACLTHPLTLHRSSVSVSISVLAPVSLALALALALAVAVAVEFAFDRHLVYRAIGRPHFAKDTRTARTEQDPQ